MDGPCAPLVSPSDVNQFCDLDQSDGDNPPSDAALQHAAESASTIAWTLAGRRHGECTVFAERPGRSGRSGCRQRLAYPGGGSRCLCACCGRGWCGCPGASTVFVGHRTPIAGVDDVRIGGASLSNSSWALVRGRQLVRRDGGVWPACQLLARDDDDEDVLVVDYRWGEPVGEYGRYAIALFACEILKAASGRECQLPSGVTSVTRQGVSLDVSSPFDFLREGRTGVYELDLWLSSVNPHGLRSPSRVWTPDVDEPVGGS